MKLIGYVVCFSVKEMSVFFGGCIIADTEQIMRRHCKSHDISVF